MYKLVQNGYVIATSKNNIFPTLMPEEEYQQIVTARATLVRREGYMYKLRDDTKTWDEFEIPPEPETYEST